MKISLVLVFWTFFDLLLLIIIIIIINSVLKVAFYLLVFSYLKILPLTSTSHREGT